MRKGDGIVSLALVLLALPSCAARRAETSQRDMRCTLMTLTEEQMLDNLVRLNEGLPILHIDYTNLNAVLTDTAGASTADLGYTKVDNVFKVIDGAAVPANDGFLGAGSKTVATRGSTSGTLATALTFQGTPVIGKSLVYAAYLDYLNLREGKMTSTHSRRLADGTMQPIMPLELSTSALPQGACILKQRYDCGWWYIPREYIVEFRSLGLAANGLSREVAPSKQVPITVRAYQRLTPQAVDGEYAYVVRLSSIVPSKSGGFIAKIDASGGDRATFSTEPATQGNILQWAPGALTPQSPILGRAIETRPQTLAEPTDEVVLRFDSSIIRRGTNPDVVLDELMARDAVNLRIGGAAPYVPTATEELLKSINDKLQQQLNQPR